MKRSARRFRKFLLGTLVLAVAAVAFLEVGSKFYVCPPPPPSARRFIVCDTFYYPVNSLKGQSVQGLVAAKLQGVEPSRADLDAAISVVAYEDMDGLNGVVCTNGMIFVRSNLGGEARYFVARHELEHVFLSTGAVPACSPEEVCATLAAAKRYPVGFIETVVSSLYLSATESPTVWCFLFGSWRIFRGYILAW